MNSKIILGLSVLVLIGLSGCTQLSYSGLPQNLIDACSNQRDNPKKIYSCEQNNLAIKYKLVDSLTNGQNINYYFDKQGNEIANCSFNFGHPAFDPPFTGKCLEIFNAQLKCEKLICDNTSNL